MSERHVVRCDERSCKTEENLLVSASTQTFTNGTGWPTTNYSVPSTWKQLSGMHFCSWACIAKYAEYAGRSAAGRPAREGE